MERGKLERFFNRTCSAREEREVWQWLCENHSTKEVEDLLQDQWRQSKYLDELDSNLDRVYLNVLSKIDLPSKSKPANLTPPSGKEKKSYPIYLKIAALFLLFLSFTYSVYYFASNASNQINMVAQIVKSTQPGSKLTTRLPDGTIVVLNSDSQIRYPEKFTGKNRQVSLVGEAYFEVAHDKEKPFIVETEQITTTALGTAFNIRSERRLNKIVVSLTEGKVMVRPTEKMDSIEAGYMLEPGEEISISLNDRDIKVSKFDVQSRVGWKDGFLVFNEADVDELKMKLENWYGVEINLINRPNKSWRFTSEYKNENLENVLKGLKFSKNIDYTIENKYVEILFNQ